MNNNIEYYNFNAFQSIPYTQYTYPQLQFQIETPPPPPKIEFHKQMMFHPPSIHTYPYFYVNTVEKKRKKNVSWGNNITFGFTYSNIEYDRTIDSAQIRDNVNKKRSYMLMKLYPQIRDVTVFEILNKMDFEK